MACGCSGGKTNIQPITPQTIVLTNTNVAEVKTIITMTLTPEIVKVKPRITFM